VSLDAPVADGAPLLADMVPDAADAAADLERGEILERAIGELPDQYREAFLLRAVEGLSHAEVGEILRLNTATARTHYHRARMMLQEAIGPALGREGKDR
jgi:RNA polymerase sigma-70 factor (ECF subfamily)